MLRNWLVYAVVFGFASEHVFSNDVSTVRPSQDLVPCKKGWFHFREKCYWVAGRRWDDRLTWKAASDRCAAVGEHLVTIESDEELDFIVTFLLLDIKRNVWIGLQDQLVESRYTWHDGSVVNYTKWRKNELWSLHSENEDCVEMLFEPEKGEIGEWNDIACSNYLAYICQASITKRKISPDPRFCSPDVGGGWKSQNSCYHIIKEKKTWYGAEEHCKKHYNGGHLVTVLDTVVDQFLDYIMPDLEEELWIGINIKGQFQQQWSSGWYVGYNGFSEDLRGLKEGYCVARNKLKEWTVVECSKKLFFICETSKTMPPVLPTPAAGSHCPEGIEGLRDLGGDYCYFIDTKNHLTWYQANFECVRRGGSLASIHSKEEIDILGPFIRYNQYTQYGMFIGLLRNLEEGEDFVWSDGTDMDFKNWNNNEPNNMDYEKCGVIDIRTLGWSDVPCHEEKWYICSIRKIGQSSSDQKTSVDNNTSHTITVEISDCSGVYDVMVKCVSGHG